MKTKRRASSAAYPKNQRVIGIDWQHGNLYLTECRQKSAADFTVMAVNAFAIPPAFNVNTKEFSLFLKEKLAFFCGTSSDVRLWAVLPESMTEQYYFRIPMVPAKERENTSVWMATKDFDLDEKAMVFDCRIGEERIELGVPKLAVAGVAATHTGLEQVKAVVEGAGYRLEGALSSAAALRNLFVSGWTKPEQEQYAVVEVADEWTRMDIYSQKTVIFSRVLRTGFVSLARGVLESYTGVPEVGEEPAPSPFTEEQIRRLLMADASLASTRADIVGQYIPDITERIVPTMERLARQLERTMEHVTSSLGYPQVERFYLSTPGGCMKLLASYLAGHFNVVCTPLHSIDGAMAPRAREEIAALGTEFREIAWGLGLSMAHPAFTLNLMSNYLERRKQIKQRRVSTLVSLASMAIVGVIAGGWLVLDMDYSALLDQEASLQRQLKGMGQKIDEMGLTMLSSEVIALRRTMENVGTKQAGAGLLFELSRVTPEAVAITEVNLVSAKVDEKKNNSGNNATAVKTASAQVQVSGFISGDILQQEASLAEFLYRLEKSPLVLSVKVDKKEQPPDVTTVLQFTATVGLV